MKVGHTVLFEIHDGNGPTTGRGKVIQEKLYEAFLITIEDVFTGDSDLIGKEINIFENEVTSIVTFKPTIKYKPRKLNYHANELK
jgi:hypothetical protein